MWSINLWRNKEMKYAGRDFKKPGEIENNGNFSHLAYEGLFHVFLMKHKNPGVLL